MVYRVSVGGFSVGIFEDQEMIAAAEDNRIRVTDGLQSEDLEKVARLTDLHVVVRLHPDQEAMQTFGLSVQHELRQ